MLLTILNWILISFVAVVFGLNFSKILKIKGLDLSLYFFLGLFSLCLVSSICSIFIPISNHFFLFILALSIFSLAYLKKHSINAISIHPLHLLIILPIGILALFMSTGDIILIVDEGSYFSQAVKWIENYPTTKGIANLEERMAYNSNVFVLDALFRMRLIYDNGFNDLNGILLIFYCIFVFRNHSSKIIAFSFQNIFGLFSLIYLFRKSLSSFEPDFLNIILGFIILSLFIKKMDENKFKDWDSDSTLICLFSFLAISVKFSSAVYLLLPIFLFYKSQWNKKALLPFSLGLLLLSIWVYRNIIISGYVVFPIPFIDLFDLDWKVPLVEAEKYYAHISEYAKRAIDVSDGLKKESIFNFSWVKNWFNAELFNKATVAGFIISLVLWLLGLRKKSKGYGLFIFLLIAILWWFIQYPSPRIAWPLIICFIAGGVNIFFKTLSFDKFTYRVMSAIWVLLIVSSFHNLSKSVPRNFNTVIYPSQSTEIKEKYNKYCWDKDLPCDSENGPIYMRGKEIKDGFKAESR